MILNFLNEEIGSPAGRVLFVEGIYCLAIRLHPQDDKPHMGTLVFNFVLILLVFMKLCQSLSVTFLKEVGLGLKLT